MRTLHLRVAQACVSRWSWRVGCRSIRWPGCSIPGCRRIRVRAIAARRMHDGFGGMLSIRVRGGETAAIAAAANVRLWKRATSLGGIESLIEHRASIEGAGSPCPTDLLRLSTGIEDVDDLFGDLDRSLTAATRTS
jgi:cystathionine gamma-synthase